MKPYNISSVNDDIDIELAWIRGLECDERGDYDEAINFYFMAARSGHDMAQSNLGVLLQDRMSPFEFEGPLFWFELSAAQGLSTAAWNAAMIFKENHNSKAFKRWILRAGELGHQNAIEIIKNKGWSYESQ